MELLQTSVQRNPSLLKPRDPKLIWKHNIYTRSQVFSNHIKISGLPKTSSDFPSACGRVDNDWFLTFWWNLSFNLSAQTLPWLMNSDPTNHPHPHHWHTHNTCTAELNWRPSVETQQVRRETARSVVALLWWHSKSASFMIEKLLWIWF